MGRKRRFPLPEHREVLDHLLESGAGTVFYDAIDGKARDRLTGEFLSTLGRQNGRRKTFEVRHDYLACIARKRGRC